MRLTKRLKHYRDALFTFVNHPQVPTDNNYAEREIWPAMLLRLASAQLQLVPLEKSGLRCGATPPRKASKCPDQPPELPL
ncbi:MAG: transposase [Candidatus Brocadiia bacterium]